MIKAKIIIPLIFSVVVVLVSGCSGTYGTTESGVEISMKQFEYAEKIKTGNLEKLPNGSFVEIEERNSSIRFIYKLQGSKKIERFLFTDTEIKKGLILLETNSRNINEITTKDGITTINYHVDPY